MLSNHLQQHIGRRQLEVEVFGIDTLFGELLAKERTRKAMAEGIAHKAVKRGGQMAICCHFVAKYMVLSPKVKRLNCTSEKPHFLSIGTSCSACGKASIERGR